MLAGSGIALRLNCEMARSAPAITTADTADKVMRAHFITKFDWKGVSIAFHNRRRICPVIIQDRIAEFLRGTTRLAQTLKWRWRGSDRPPILSRNVMTRL